jgi:hypothetical protein
MIGDRPGRARFWLWAAGEVCVVALGVLVAFGLNEWWVERTARRDEQTHLRALASDFERNVAVYEELIGREETAVNASLELLQLARKDPDSDSAAVRRLLGGVFQSHREKPALDAYEALVNSAGLALLRDEGLRSALAGFAARATDPYSERFSDQLYMAFTNRYIGRLQIAGQVAQESSAPESYAELLRDPAFQEHLALRHVVEGDVASDYRRSLREAQNILEQLRTQIDD